eukprot:tig00000215_g18595.t1
MGFTIAGVDAGQGTPDSGKPAAHRARHGVLAGAQGELETPALLVYTRRGSPIALTAQTLASIPGARCLEMNVFDLCDSPGANVMRLFGKRIHDFLNFRDRLVFLNTRDSLAFRSCPPVSASQVSSESFGGRTSLSPQGFMDIVDTFKPDFFACLSDEVPATVGQKRVRKSVDHTLGYHEQCLALHRHRERSQMFGVVQGAWDVRERVRCAQKVAAMDVAGFVLGGFGLGESPADRDACIAAVLDALPPDKPRLLTGLGSPEDIVKYVDWGIDLFDSAYPVVMSQFGYAMDLGAAIRAGSGEDGAAPGAGLDVVDTKVNLWDKKHAGDDGPLVAGCACFACRKHSRAFERVMRVVREGHRSYVNHLLITHEMLAEVLLNLEGHNLHQYEEFFAAVRRHLREGSWPRFRAGFLAARAGGGGGAGGGADGPPTA